MVSPNNSPFIDEYINSVDQHLQKLLDTDNPLLSQIGNYICQSGGKRVRAVLLLLCSQLAGFQGQKERIVHLASIIEFIHAATLLHDDVIDNAHMRRGNPSANRKWGNQLPVLVGDYLYAKSFFFLVKDNNTTIMETVSSSVATITDGEILQLQKSANFSISEKEYIEIITKKTSVLMAASCKIGAILGDVSQEKVDALYNFGIDIGIAFQLIDDMLDYTSQETKLGKPVYNDLKGGNCTLPLIYTLQHASPAELTRINKILFQEEYSDEELSWVGQLIKRHKADQYTLDRARWYVQSAQQRLSIFTNSDYRQYLIDLSDYIIHRDF
ncbi:MAG: polyprenyl synthetase family protein [Deltaproteobacteria bacterium]|nr:polyprenyl synthetase family protein [Deltaproteobacteria bacterium]